MGKDFEPRYKPYSKDDLRISAVTRGVPETPMPKRAPNGTKYFSGTLFLNTGSGKIRPSIIDNSYTLTPPKHIEKFIIPPILTGNYEKRTYTFKGKDYATLEALEAAMKAWDEKFNGKRYSEFKSPVTGKEYPGTMAGLDQMCTDDIAWKAWRTNLTEPKK
ncbi:MAG: hypothetical protein G01um10145_23 [Microgenomates group bacterium Gr01-1014_5]|nr:MAG: hypothetical protein G01um10145_23 [Microgenomates group bacterium Gr01-1014_5]